MEVNRVERRFGRAMDVWVEAVQDPQAGVVDVAVDIVGEQDGGRREGDDQDDDRRPEQAGAALVGWAPQLDAPAYSVPAPPAALPPSTPAPPLPYSGGGGGT